MDRTAEVRWFFKGPPPEALASWFGRLGAEPRERSDLYLGLGRTDALGIKLRGGPGGNIEFKVRERDHGPRELLAGITGNVEEWRKWSFGTDASTPGLGLPTDLWVEVRKMRRSASYQPPGFEPWVEAARQGDGCSVELTELRLPGDDWSTLGFEAFGSEDTVLASLERAVCAFFAGLHPPEVMGGHLSSGYPGWLRRTRAFPAP
jgi:hypothetical protein